MLSRRAFILGGTVFTLQLTGCGFMLLARMAFRGRMIRGASRAVRSGRGSTVYSYGRGVSIATQAVRIARTINSLNQLQSNLTIIREEDQRPVAEISGDKDHVSCKLPEGATLIYSNRDGKHLFHESVILSGGRKGIPCGYSSIGDDGINTHYNNENNIVGYCKVKPHKVTHYDVGGSRVGVSGVDFNRKGIPTVRSPGLERALNDLLNDTKFHDQDMRIKMAELERLISECSKSRKNDSCSSDTHIIIARALQELERVQ